MAVLSRDQLAAAERYRRAYAIGFGLPWRGACILGDHQGTEVSDDILERVRQQYEDMATKLTPEQKLQIDNLVISAWIPTCVFAAQGIGRPLATDEREREALLTGLNECPDLVVEI